MGRGPSRAQSKAGTEERAEFKGPGVKFEALAPSSQIYQWSLDVKTGGHPGSNSSQVWRRRADRFLQGSVWWARQAGRQAPPPLWLG